MYDVDVVVKQDIKYSQQKIDVKISKRFKDFIDEDESKK